MSYIDEHKAKFDNLKISLDLKNRDQLRRKANGGNSILFVYTPEEEIKYISKAKEIFSKDKYAFIDIAQLLVDFIEENTFEKVKKRYQIFSATPHKVFTSGEKSFLEFIISEIIIADKDGFIPILVRTGALYGTGIENVNIMENKNVMTMNFPLVIFYPAKIEDDNLYFLNFKPASKYRCTVIE